jgi:spore coat protein CotF
MTYKAITDPNQKQEFITWLKNMLNDLKDKKEEPNVKTLFPNSELGDVGTAKDLVGSFLATLTGEPVTID